MLTKNIATLTLKAKCVIWAIIALSTKQYATRTKTKRSWFFAEVFAERNTRDYCTHAFALYISFLRVLIFCLSNSFLIFTSILGILIQHMKNGARLIWADIPTFYGLTNTQLFIMKNTNNGKKYWFQHVGYLVIIQAHSLKSTNTILVFVQQHISTNCEPFC